MNNVLIQKLYNTNFDDIELPGFFTHKLTEPTNENRVFISRIETEFSFKFINFSHRKLLIRGSNEKLYNFLIHYDIYKDSSENKILQLQTILNSIYSSNKDTYKTNVKFNIPIKYDLTKNIKLIQEDTNQYYMNEVYEFCMQKFGYDPEIGYEIYQSLGKDENDFMSEDILSKVYKDMIQKIPNYNLKNFIHKFIINCDEIFIFRKQFATSLAINNLLSYIFKIQNNMKLNKISFNKETGSITIHDNQYDSYAKFSSSKSNIPFRITRNINVYK